MTNRVNPGVPRRRSALIAAALLPILGVIALLGFGFAEARRDPIRRTATLHLADWPAGAHPLRVALVSDIHLGNAATDRDRMDRVIARVAADRPDLVLLAGDYVARNGQAEAASAAGQVARSLAALRPPLGIVAVLGNHDNWTAPAQIARALRGIGVVVVENGAVRRGPLLIGGVGDTTSGHAKLGGTLNALRRLNDAQPGARLYLSHSPDIARWLPDRDALLLAGHTHCGQIVLPLIGPITTVSSLFGNSLRCGFVTLGNRRVVVTSGTGSSIVPIRIGAPPDYWLLTLGR